MNPRLERFTPLFRKFLGLNWPLTVTIVGLLIFGVSAIYSASWMREDLGLSTKWRQQVVWILVGLCVYFGVSLIDYKWMRWASLPFYLVGLVLLLVVLKSGDEVHGTRGWLFIGGFGFQPSQVAIAAGVVFVAFLLSELPKLNPIFEYQFLRLAIAGLAGAIPFLLVLKQGDFGSAIVWLPVIGAMLLVARIPYRYLIVICLCGTLVLPFGYFFGLKDYQKRRITVQIDMLRGKEVNRQDEAYNAYNNLLAIGSGGLTGKGFKAENSINRQGFISPTTAINDFIFVVLAEEHGFRGAALMLSAFLLLLIQCLFVAFWGRDMFGQLMVAGVVGLFLAHIFQNVGMNLLLMPITGIPLPLISYGGTFAVMVLFLLGLVQSVWVHRQDREEPAQSGMQIDHLG